MEKIIKLRPHHLLCTQGYSGKGYSENFVQNMDKVVSRLRTDKNAQVQIVFDTDCLCQECPSKIGEGICENDEKVLRFDQGVIDAINLKEGVYLYQELILKLDMYLFEMEDDLRMKSICGDCEWYESSACRDNIKTGKYIL